jgi:predicted RNA methylase
MTAMPTLASTGHRLVRAFRRRGPLEFVKLCGRNLMLVGSGQAAKHRYVHDDSWDRSNGVDTAGTVEIDEITAPAHEKPGAVRYEPTPPDCFNHLLDAAGLGCRADYTFIDVGSGKGRVLLLAALAGFERVIGIELGEELHQAACRNIAAMKERLGRAELSSVRADAAGYQLPLQPTICFLNNPFDTAVLDRLLDNIEASLATHPRPFTIVYYHSNHADRLDRRRPWQVVAKGVWQDESHHFAIYRAATGG